MALSGQEYVDLYAADVKKAMDPKNELMVEIYESSPDCYQFKRTVSLQPEWNEQGCMKVLSNPFVKTNVKACTLIPTL